MLHNHRALIRKTSSVRLSQHPLRAQQGRQHRAHALAYTLYIEPHGCVQHTIADVERLT